MRNINITAAMIEVEAIKIVEFFQTSSEDSVGL
jgi:hypothetical protein